MELAPVNALADLSVEMDCEDRTKETTAVYYNCGLWAMGLISYGNITY